MHLHHKCTATSVLHDGNNSVLGVSVHQSGPGSSEEGTESKVLARSTLFAEGTHGCLSELWHNLARMTSCRCLWQAMPTQVLVSSE